ncbi:MAG: hypothetical protein J6R18_05825, partial [Kiritimatiellae bacterium]|nr:hypothetical protein [Kiritimatiellia bacterium]
MKKKYGLMFLSVVLSIGAVFAAQINWQPVNGDWNGDFGDANHWNGGKVPDSDDTAYFPPESSPAEFTVTVGSEYSVGTIYVGHFPNASGRTVTFSGSGKITSTLSNGVNYFGYNSRVVFDGVSLSAGYQCGCYGHLEIKGGSSFVCRNNFYFFEDINHSGMNSLVIDGGTCQLSRIICNGAPAGMLLEVKAGVLKTPNDILGTYSGKPVVVDVKGGTAEIKTLTMNQPGSAIRLSGGLMKITGTDDTALNVAQSVEVSLTGGTFEHKRQHADPRFYATDGADVDMGTCLVYATNTVKVRSSGALIARGFRNGSTANCVLDGTFPKIIFTYADGNFYVESGNARNFYLKGPTMIGSTCNLILNAAATTSYTYFRGDLTVDTLDYKDRSTKRNIMIRGLHPEDGEATLTVKGGGSFQMLQAFSYNSFKSVSVEDNTTLDLLTATMGQ